LIWRLRLDVLARIRQRLVRFELGLGYCLAAIDLMVEVFEAVEVVGMLVVKLPMS
jgi:hypothetical protein